MAEAVINDIFIHSSSTDDGAIGLLKERSIKLKMSLNCGVTNFRTSIIIIIIITSISRLTNRSHY